LDTVTGELLRNGATVPLAPKTRHLLLLLLAERPQALTKEDLIKCLWPDAPMPEGGLASLVSDLRRAIGDQPRHSRFVRSVRGVGYAWRGATLLTPEQRPAPGQRAHCLEWMGRALPLADGGNIVGRVQAANVRISDPAVSRRHARIVVAPGGAILEDLVSKNGTRLNGKRISGPVSIEDGDEIEVGGAKLIFRVSSAGDDAATTVAAKLSRD
jgi:DNA-binding winged helix-turn-helix (wHTH) protein